MNSVILLLNVGCLRCTDCHYHFFIVVEVAEIVVISHCKRCHYFYIFVVTFSLFISAHSHDHCIFL